MSTFGWRWWDLSPSGSLQSVNNVLWPPNEPLQAVCEFGLHTRHRPGDVVPVEHCSCGYWAFYDPEMAEGLPHSHGYFKTTKVFGVVEAWGGIVWHEWGFRAEWVVPRAVVVRRGKLHKAYEIPRYRTVDELCAIWDVAPLDEETQA